MRNIFTGSKLRKNDELRFFAKKNCFSHYPIITSKTAHLFYYLSTIYISGNAVVGEEGDTYRDTMVATLLGDGRHLEPFYVESQYANASYASGRRPDPGEKPVKGMNIGKMKEYIDHIDVQVDEPKVLIFDRLSSHISKEVRDYAHSKKCSDGRQKFITMLLPPKAAFLISPCDMGFFSMWKSDFYKYDRSTKALKFSAAKQVWKSVDPEKVKNLFINCGLTSKEAQHVLRQRLVNEVRGGIPEELEDVWDFYDGWLSGAFEVEGATRPRSAPLEKPIQLPDAELNGVYWRNYGAHGHSP